MSKWLQKEAEELAEGPFPTGQNPMDLSPQHMHCRLLPHWTMPSLVDEQAARPNTLEAALSPLRAGE